MKKTTAFFFGLSCLLIGYNLGLASKKEGAGIKFNFGDIGSNNKVYEHKSEDNVEDSEQELRELDGVE